MPDGLASELNAAIDAARAGGTLLRAGFLAPGRSRRKGPHDVVSDLDRASELAIFERLGSAFPCDDLLGEEAGWQRARGAGRAPSGRTWVVDPLDGTIDFVSGVPFFCVSVALAVGADVALGVIHDPLRGETFVAVRDRGARLLTDEGAPPRLGEPLAPRRLARLADAVVSAEVGDPGDAAGGFRIAALRRRVRAIRALGSTALSLAYAAAGRLDGVLQTSGLAAVDVAAGGLIAREAGLRVTDAGGGPWIDLADPWRGPGIAAALPALHRLLLGDAAA